MTIPSHYPTPNAGPTSGTVARRGNFMRSSTQKVVRQTTIAALSVSALDQALAIVKDRQRQVQTMVESARHMAETDIPAALALCERAIALAGQDESDKNPLLDQLAECFHLEGTLFLNKGDYGAALVSFSHAKTVYESRSDTDRAAVEICFMGISQGYAGLYPDGLQNLHAALTVFEMNDDRPMLANALNSIGHVYGQLNEHARGLPYLLQSVEIARTSEDKKALSTALDSLCQAYLGVGKLDDALACGLESLQACREIGASVREAEHLLSVGSVHLARGGLALAKECFQESLTKSRKYGYRFAEAGALRRLGATYRAQNQISEAFSTLREAVALFRNIGAKRDIYQCLEDLAAVCKQTGDFERALNYYEEFQLAKETILAEQADIRLTSLEIKYEVEQSKKEKEIYYLKNVALQKEIDERIKAQTALEVLATTDQLTGLVNRRHLLNVGERELKQAVRHRFPLSLVIFDIDHFKKVNDNYGHTVGDKVLTEVSRFVKHSLRGTDIVGRYGGEEFVILLPHTSVEAARQKVERIRQDIGSVFVQAGEVKVSVTISSGIAGLLEAGQADSLDHLIERADSALYEAKEAGRNQTVIYKNHLI